MRHRSSELVCCGQPMQLQTENTVDAAQEKHIPVVEKNDPGDERGARNSIRVKVGSLAHPMEEAHYIEWIEITTADSRRVKKFLKPGDKPEVEFHADAEIISARAYCSLHGLWASKK